MSNSKLVAHTRISPNKNSPRLYKIDTITIHVVEGQVTAEALGEVFANPARQASSNYGVDKDGRIGLYVDENDRAWTSGSYDNDHRAITIEVASDTEPPYKVNDKALDALVELLVDICKRNEIPALLWKNNPRLIYNPELQNMTVHRWFQDTSCPGEYMMSKMGEIAERVNEKLGVKFDEKPEARPQVSLVQIKTGAKYTNNVPVPEQYTNRTFQTSQVLADRSLVTELNSWVWNKGLVFLGEKKEEKPVEEAPVKKGIKDGDLVQILSGAVYTNGVKVPERYIGQTFTASKVEQNRSLISELNSWVPVSYLKKVGEEAPTPKKKWEAGVKVSINQGAKYTNGVNVPRDYIGETYTIMQANESAVLVKELYSWIEKKYLTLV